MFLKTFYFFTTDKDTDNSLFIISSVVVSAIIVAIVRVIFSCLVFNLWLFFAFYIAFALAFAIGFAKMYEAAWFNQVFRHINYKSIHKSLWRDVIDYKLGTSAIVFLKNRDIRYIGELIEHEENGDESYIVLSNYIVADYLTGHIFSDETDNDKAIVIINLRDIDRIELFYDEETKILDR